MLEAAASRDCVVHVETSARGFGPIWQAVMDDFHARHPLAGVRISINDMGATPAVVSLRLDQAVAKITGARP
jgi:malonate decarboxylase delta subunit